MIFARWAFSLLQQHNTRNQSTHDYSFVQHDRCRYVERSHSFILSKKSSSNTAIRVRKQFQNAGDGGHIMSTYLVLIMQLLCQRAAVADTALTAVETQPVYGMLNVDVGGTQPSAAGRVHLVYSSQWMKAEQCTRACTRYHSCDRAADKRCRLAR